MFWLLLLPAVAPPVVVYAEAVVPVERTFFEESYFQGQILPAQSLQIQASQEGKVVRLAVREGARVQAGDLLVQLDSRLEEQELKEVQTQWQLAQRKVQRVQAWLAAERRAEAKLTPEQEYRLETLLDQAKLEESRAKQVWIRQQRRVEGTRIRAERAGRVERLEVQQGQWVRPEMQVATLIPDQPLRVQFSVDLDLYRLVSPLLEGKQKIPEPIQVSQKKYVEDQEITYYPVRLPARIEWAQEDGFQQKRWVRQITVELPGRNLPFEEREQVDVTVRLSPEYKGVPLPLEVMYAEEDLQIESEPADPAVPTLKVLDAQGKIVLRQVKTRLWETQLMGASVLTKGLHPGDRLLVQHSNPWEEVLASTATKTLPIIVLQPAEKGERSDP
jgi:biotin carboxyl carrier protein